MSILIKWNFAWIWELYLDFFHYIFSEGNLNEKIRDLECVKNIKLFIKSQMDKFNGDDYW